MVFHSFLVAALALLCSALLADAQFPPTPKYDKRVPRNFRPENLQVDIALNDYDESLGHPLENMGFLLNQVHFLEHCLNSQFTYEYTKGAKV
jgi:hypothetical protein